MTTRTCSQCNSSLNEGDVFCHNCGAESASIRSQICASCEKDIGLDAKFCPNCGTPRITPKASQANNSGTFIIADPEGLKAALEASPNAKINNYDAGLRLGKWVSNNSMLVGFIGIGLLLFVIVVVLLINSNNVERSENSYSPAQNVKDTVKSKLQQGIEYTWYKGGGCAPGDNTVCLAYDDYQLLCNSSEGLTEGATSMLGMYENGYRELLKGGDVSNIRVYWSSNYDYPCRATATVSGIYRGTSARVTAEGGVSTFILNSQNELLVRSADSLNN